MDVGVLTTNPANASLPGIMGHAGVDTLSLARTWQQLDTEGFVQFDRALAIARGKGKKLTPRVRGGYGTPLRFMDRTYVPTSGIPKGKVIPCPVLENGAPNVTWLGGFREMTRSLAGWVNAKLEPGDGPVHLTWPGGLSAEIYVSQQLMGMEGANAETVASMHRLVVETAAAMDVPNPVELSISGLEQGDILKAVQDDIVEEMIAANRYREFWTQRNGFSDGGGPAARTPDPSIGYGVQMVKAFRPQDGKPFNWATVFAKARTANVAFIEIYDASFAHPRTGQPAPGSAQLYAECAQA